MGKTVESYRLALESEIHRWDGFARALRKEDREAFEELIMCRSYALAETFFPRVKSLKPVLNKLGFSTHMRVL